MVNNPLAAAFAKLALRTAPPVRKTSAPQGLVETRQCVECGADFSVKDMHRRCKKCRDSNLKFDMSAKQKCTRAIRDHARPRGVAPDFQRFDEQLKTWTQVQHERRKLAAMLARIDETP